MRRFRIQHHTSLAYSTPVSASHNELRMTPTTETGQTALENRIKVRPMTWNHVYQDYWGTHVTAMAVAGEHQRLEIDAVSTVERTTVAGGPGGASWDDLRTDSVNDAYYEWLALDAHTRLPSALTDQVGADTDGRSVPQAAEHVFGLVSGHLEYQPGVTAVHSSSEEAWRERGGVCQDYAHVTVGLLRALHIPARYVSGYLAPWEDSDIGETATGESHAWVEWWDGAWQAWDPTNARPVGLDHIVVGRGRDYRDVPPLVGVFSGEGDSSLTVAVTFTRLR